MSAKKYNRYRIEVGLHVQDLVEYDPKQNKEVTKRDEKGKAPEYVYTKGDVFDSTHDLAGPEFNGPGGMTPKFVKVGWDTPRSGGRLSGSPAPAPEPALKRTAADGEDTLRAMTVDQLMKLADEEGYTIPPSAKTKDDLIKVIKLAQQE